MEHDVKPVVLDRKACYAALTAHDSRFDGKFFVGVSSTGIYCRPVCRVKRPKEKNCSFYASAAAAEAAGYRPCLKCRPELAPAWPPALSPVDAAGRLARKAAFTMAEDCLADHSLEDLAGRLGISSRHLRRIFYAEYGVSPVQYLQTLRLLLAKNLLTDTVLPVTEIAMTAGFGSLRRFNTLFKERYRLTPRSLRKTDAPPDKGITLLIGFRPPYDWDGIISFLAGRAIPGIESVAGGASGRASYRRTVTVPDKGSVCRGWISVSAAAKKDTLALTVSPSLIPVLSKVLSRVRLLFDTGCSPQEIYERLIVMNTIAPGLCRPGARLPGSFDPFEMSVRAVLGQQVTVKAARTLAGRFAQALGGEITTPFEDLTHTFPQPENIMALKKPAETILGELGIIRSRSRSIYALAEALTAGSITLSPEADPEAEMEKLLLLPGFGPWTVNYIGMRALSWPDAFPHTDYGIKKALPGKTAKEILALAENWRPWRSYAAINLWNSLSGGT
ncbi:MAG: helix-turn-helix domain-containing protein [Treponema sp.]|jgi:AraC family transcriptional regulator of adaptative response / DNA-3-methyladenine glycosylase II|nr:helix-turn-helix domain-containing protein [Treponema sp.]